MVGKGGRATMDDLVCHIVVQTHPTVEQVLRSVQEGREDLLYAPLAPEGPSVALLLTALWVMLAYAFLALRGRGADKPRRLRLLGPGEADA